MYLLSAKQNLEKQTDRQTEYRRGRVILTCFFKLSNYFNDIIVTCVTQLNPQCG